MARRTCPSLLPRSDEHPAAAVLAQPVGTAVGAVHLKKICQLLAALQPHTQSVSERYGLTAVADPPREALHLLAGEVIGVDVNLGVHKLCHCSISSLKGYKKNHAVR